MPQKSISVVTSFVLVRVTSWIVPLSRKTRKIHEVTRTNTNQKYSVEVLQDFRLPRPHADLTGVWAADDVGTYYVRQVGDTVWWLGLSRDRGQTFANVFQGTIQRGAGPGELMLSGDFADIPLGGFRNSGSIRLQGPLGSGTTSPTALDKLSSTGRFGAGKWEKLYDRVILKVGPVALP